MRFYITIILLFVSFQSLSYAGNEAANKLYENGKYKQAFKAYLPLAEKDDPEAQDMVGMMYMLGVGTKKNYALGSLWLSLAARQGIDHARETRDALIDEWKEDIIRDLTSLK